MERLSALISTKLDSYLLFFVTIYVDFRHVPLVKFWFQSSRGLKGMHIVIVLVLQRDKNICLV